MKRPDTTPATPPKTRPFRVYVAAPFEDAAHVRQLHRRLRDLGMEPTSSWHAANPDSIREGDLPRTFTPAEKADACEENDRAILQSDAILVLARPGAGGEMFCEMTLARHYGVKVFYVGPQREVLSAFRKGVLRFASESQALDALRERARGIGLYPPAPLE